LIKKDRKNNNNALIGMLYRNHHQRGNKLDGEILTGFLKKEYVAPRNVALQLGAFIMHSSKKERLLN